MNKKLLMGAVVLVLLSGLVYSRMKSDANLGTVGANKVDLPEIKGSDDVDKISITHSSKQEGKDQREEVVLVKKGEKWELEKPVSFMANQASVKTLLDNIKEIKGKEVIVKEASEDSKKMYDLSSDKALHLVAFKGQEKKLDWSFGKSGSRGQTMMMEGKPGIYSVDGYSGYVYSRETKLWRDGEIFKFDEKAVAQFSIENKAGLFSFTKGEKWAGTFRGQAISRFDSKKPEDALRAFKSLTADDYGDGKSEAEVGLDKPESRVHIQLKDNAGDYTLKIGKTVAATQSRYAKKDGSDTIYVISSWPSEWALAEESKFQEPADAGVAKDAGKK